MYEMQLAISYLRFALLVIKRGKLENQNMANGFTLLSRWDDEHFVGTG